MNIKLEYHGGDGYSRCKDAGSYEVKYTYLISSKDKSFDSLDEAKDFYDNLKCEKAIWNKDTMELLECHAYTSGDRDGTDLPF